MSTAVLKPGSRIIITDPFASPTYLAPYLAKAGIEVIVVYTLHDRLSEAERAMRFHPELFFKAIYFAPEKDNIDNLVKELIALNASYVLYGIEQTVSFTDTLAEKLAAHFKQTRYTNDPKTSHFRHDKYEMQHALELSGLPTVKQLKLTRGISSIAAQKMFADWSFPVIIKPINGGASFGVKKVDDLEGLTQALQEAPEECLGHQLDELVMQELLTGIEYFVDSFSVNGKHYISSVQSYEKMLFQGRPVYRYVEIISLKDPVYKICTEFVKEALTAVGLNNGFGHTELFLTPNGPRLIEINPRISGISGFANMLSEMTNGVSQPMLLVDFLKLGEENLTKHPQQKAYGRVAILQTWRAGRLGEFVADKVRQLSSYQTHVILKSPDTQMDLPKTLADSVAYILLVNEDEEILHRDYAQLKEWEENHELFIQ